MDDHFIEQEPAINAQAFMDLADANISPGDDKDSWEIEVRFLYQTYMRDHDQALNDMLSEAMILG
jgi:hypothetical protein